MGFEIINSVCPKDCFGSCGLQVKVENGKAVEIKGDNHHPLTGGRLCSKGKNYLSRVYSSKRLLYPMKSIGFRGEGKFERISWDEALNIIYKKLRKLKIQFGPESILYYRRFANLGIMKNYASGFWNQFGGYTTTYGGLCDAAAQEAIKLTYGAVRHNRISDIENSRLIILWGINPAYTHIHFQYYLNKAIAKGAKLISIDVRKNESEKKSVLSLRPRPGTDGCLSLGIAHQLIKRNVQDKIFLEKYTFGFTQFKEMVREYPLNYVSSVTEIPEDKIEKLVDYIEEYPEYALFCGMGVQRYTNGGQTVRSISLLPALTGSLGKIGCGIYFSDRQVPEPNWPFIPPNSANIRNSIPIAKLGSEIEKQTNPPIKAAWIEQGNPMTSNPDVNLLAKSLNKLDFIVVSELFMTDTANMADIILPAASILEYNDLIIGYGHSYIQLQQKTIEPPGECKHESEVYRLLGKKFNFNLKYLPENDLAIIEKIIEKANFSTSVNELKEKPYLPSSYQEIAFDDMKFDTPSGKIEFFSQKTADDWKKDPLPIYYEPFESKYSTPDLYQKYPLTLISIHTRNKMNSQFSDMAAYKEEPFIQINSEDAKKRKIAMEDKVKVYNDRGNIVLTARVSSEMPEGIVRVNFGWWNIVHKVNVNMLTGEYESDIGNGTAFHNCLVEMKKVQ